MGVDLKNGLTQFHQLVGINRVPFGAQAGMMPVIQFRLAGAQVFRFENGENLYAKPERVIINYPVDKRARMIGPVDAKSIAVDVPQDTDIAGGRFEPRQQLVVSRWHTAHGNVPQLSGRPQPGSRTPYAV